MKRNCYCLTGFFVVLFLVGAGSLDKGGAGETEVAGNNLSFPVIWSDGVAKTLRGTEGMDPLTGGTWWYWWGGGFDEEENPLFCAPDPDDDFFCDDGVDDSHGAEPGGHERVYPQQDADNVWQAGTIIPDDQVIIDWIDWGDNLEAVPWYTNSMVRVEVVLIQELFDDDGQHRYGQAVDQYVMSYLSGWGKDEMWGLSIPTGSVPDENGNYQGEKIEDAPQATVYSHCARLTIQPLLVDKLDPLLQGLVWVEPYMVNDDFFGGWECPTCPSDTTDPLVDNPIFSKVVREVGDGPGYYSAEINVKGKVIYGYTWDVGDNNAGAGYYRITFSLDPQTLCPELNTSFSASDTEIFLPIEEEEVTTSAESGDVPSGGTAVIFEDQQNVTYIDINIIERVTRKGKK